MGGNKSEHAPLGHRHSTARVSKRPTDESAAQQSRAVLYRPHVFRFRQLMAPLIFLFDIFLSAFPSCFWKRLKPPVMSNGLM